MSKLHCLLLIHGDTIEEVRRNIIATAQEVEVVYAIMGDRGNQINWRGEFQFVKSEFMKDVVDELNS